MNNNITINLDNIPIFRISSINNTPNFDNMPIFNINPNNTMLNLKNMPIFHMKPINSIQQFGLQDITKYHIQPSNSIVMQSQYQTPLLPQTSVNIKKRKLTNVTLQLNSIPNKKQKINNNEYERMKSKLFNNDEKELNAYHTLLSNNNDYNDLPIDLKREICEFCIGTISKCSKCNKDIARVKSGDRHFDYPSRRDVVNNWSCYKCQKLFCGDCDALQCENCQDWYCGCKDSGYHCTSCNDFHCCYCLPPKDYDWIICEKCDILYCKWCKPKKKENSCNKCGSSTAWGYGPYEYYL